MKRAILLYLLAVTCLGQTNPMCTHGEEAFSKTLYGSLRGRCTTCHDVDGIGPPHSTSDPFQSYQSILPLVDFENPERSYFMDLVNEQHWKAYPQGKEVEYHPSGALADLRAWWESGQNLCSKETGVNTEAVSLDPSWPSTYFKPIKARFLSEEPFAKGLTFEAEIKALLTGDMVTGYLVRQPRLTSVGASVAIERLSFLLNGIELSDASTFFSIRTKVNAVNASQRGPLLSAGYAILRKHSPGTDNLVFSFRKLTGVSPWECQYVDDFKKATLPVLENRACYFCHGGGPTHEVGQAAKQVFDMDVSAEVLCDSALQRAATDEMSLIPFISLPLKGTLDHPRVIIYGTEVFPSWSNWIQKERAHLAKGSR